MIWHDIRLKRTLLDIIFPSPKKKMGPRNLAYLKLVLADKRKCVLFATFPKSGWNWTGDIIGYCLYKKYKGTYDITYKDGDGHLRDRMVKPFIMAYPADSRARHGLKIRDQFPELDIDYLLHVHEFHGYSPLWGLDDARTIFITRHIPTSLYSNFKTKSQVNHYDSFEQFLDTGFLDRVINFHNTWGDFREKHDPSHCEVVKYEDLRDDPTTHFKRIHDFVFQRPIDEELLREALDFFSFQKQKEREFKLQNDESKHFHFRGAKDYNDQIKPETLDRIHRRIHKDLRHTFGYDYPKPS